MNGAPLDDRRRAELLAKLESLEVEFGVWRADSEEGQPLRKHHSQIRRVTTALDGLISQIRAAIKPDSGQQILGDGPRIERQMLELHRMWDYFRAKLLLRQSPAFERFLYAADELAWACYEPVQRQTAEQRAHRLKEPPLTFFNGAWSPYAAGRGRAYEAERVEGALLRMTSVHDSIRRLPIPVVGVPWYLATHLADAPVICHEVGHLVEQDFGLTEALDEALALVPLDAGHRPAWQAWRNELFADVYGCLGAGPAFVSALMGFLADAPAKVTAQERRPPGWEKYPTTALRMEFNFAVLRAMGLENPSTLLEERWSAFYGYDKMEAFRGDVEAVAVALLTTPLAPLGSDVAIRDVLRFRAVDQEVAEAQAKGLLLKTSPKPGDARRVHAAVRIAFDTDPATYAETLAGERALNALWDARDRKVRRADRAPAVEDLADADRSLGASIFEGLQQGSQEDADEGNENP